MPTVLVVEDDALIRDAVSEILALEGFVPVPVGNGREALLLLRDGRLRPAIILLDLMMPVMNGWEFRAEQLRDPALAAIPVVVMSASDRGGISADAHVPKPFDIPVLLSAMARASPACRAEAADQREPSTSGTCRSATEFMQ